MQAIQVADGTHGAAGPLVLPAGRQHQAPAPGPTGPPKVSL
jgi:hypothetical protein